MILRLTRGLRGGTTKQTEPRNELGNAELNAFRVHKSWTATYRQALEARIGRRVALPVACRTREIRESQLNEINEAGCSPAGARLRALSTFGDWCLRQYFALRGVGPSNPADPCTWPSPIANLISSSSARLSAVVSLRLPLLEHHGLPVQ